MGDKRASRCKEHALQLLATKSIMEASGARDERIASLIRYNSEQVILRRETQARLLNAYEALKAARSQFLDYARQHRAKGTPEAHAKAEVNMAMADMMNEALSFHLEPGSMGKP